MTDNNNNNSPAKPRNSSADRAVVIGRVSRREIREMDAAAARNREIEKEAAAVRAARAAQDAKD